MITRLHGRGKSPATEVHRRLDRAPGPDGRRAGRKHRARRPRVGSLGDEMADSPFLEPIAPALSFGAVADAYDRARPSYPLEAARWLAGDRPVDVLELGAGTGKLTEPLVGLGHRVLATDPLAADARAAAPLPGRRARRWRRASPSGSPCARARADVVVAGQAFHWFDLSRALPEVARVLRPGGRIALAWNVRDETVPWVRRLGRLVGSTGAAGRPTHDLQAPPVRVRRDRDVPVLAAAGPRPAARPVRPPLPRGDDARVRARAGTARGRRALRRLRPGRTTGMLLPYLTRCYRAVVPGTGSRGRPTGRARPPRSAGTGTATAAMPTTCSSTSADEGRRRPRPIVCA